MRGVDSTEMERRFAPGWTLVSAGLGLRQRGYQSGETGDDCAGKQRLESVALLSCSVLESTIEDAGDRRIMLIQRGEARIFVPVQLG